MQYLPTDKALLINIVDNLKEMKSPVKSLRKHTIKNIVCGKSAKGNRQSCFLSTHMPFAYHKVLHSCYTYITYACRLGAVCQQLQRELPLKCSFLYIFLLKELIGTQYFLMQSIVI